MEKQLEWQRIENAVPWPLCFDRKFKWHFLQSFWSSFGRQSLSHFLFLPYLSLFSIVWPSGANGTNRWLRTLKRRKKEEKGTELMQCQSDRLYLKWSSNWARAQFRSCASSTKKLRKKRMHLLSLRLSLERKKNEGEQQKNVNDVHLAADLINSRQDDLSKYLRGNFPLFSLFHFLLFTATLHTIPCEKTNNNNLHSSLHYCSFSQLLEWPQPPSMPLQFTTTVIVERVKWERKNAFILRFQALLSGVSARIDTPAYGTPLFPLWK